MVAHASDVLGLNVLCQRIEEVPIDHFPDKFDVIVMLDVLEHVPRPLRVLEKVSHWTHPGSPLLIRGPLSNDPIARLKGAARRLVGKVKKLPGYPLDVNSFTKKSLSVLLATHGFQVQSWINESRGFANTLARRL
jgi:2-polyprenyl-3-methyl-5-hydroxy-6-metoxy-1,4-benzoquinol methylase